MIRLTKEQITSLAEEGIVEGFEGWGLDYDTYTGDFDAEKGAMCDFEISLYDNNGKLVGIAYGGYYTAVSGAMFSYDLDFEAPEAETPLTKFNDFLMEISEDNISLEKKIKKIKKYIDKL
jgi:hypothetical protein